MPPPKATSGIPFITISNIVKRTRVIDFDGSFLVPPEYFARLKPNRKPRRGDVLYTVTGATLGIPVLVDSDSDFCFQRHIALIRPRAGVSSEWLSYAMASPQVFAQATSGATGAAQKTVGLNVLRSIKVPRPSEPLQTDVTMLLKQLFSETYKLENLVRTKLAALDELRKSLLHQAFSGQL
jgi:type I restriction enzyme S subunit